MDEPVRFSKDSDSGAGPHRRVHDGEGLVRIRRFDFPANRSKANFVIFDMPPKSSEGVHTHDYDQSRPLDEFYYVIAGEGVMRIDDQDVAVSAGDHVHVPLGVPHGIANASPAEHLKIMITYVEIAPATTG